jgi:hypothetical protein
MYVFVRCVYILPLSTIFLMNFGIALTVWYFFFILFHSTICHLYCKDWNTKVAPSGAGTASPSVAHEFTSIFVGYELVNL